MVIHNQPGGTHNFTTVYYDYQAAPRLAHRQGHRVGSPVRHRSCRHLLPPALVQRGGVGAEVYQQQQQQQQQDRERDREQ